MIASILSLTTSSTVLIFEQTTYLAFLISVFLSLHRTAKKAVLATTDLLNHPGHSIADFKVPEPWQDIAGSCSSRMPQ